MVILLQNLTPLLFSLFPGTEIMFLLPRLPSDLPTATIQSSWAVSHLGPIMDKGHETLGTWLASTVQTFPDTWILSWPRW